ncbi:period circadian protein [Aricia agestis]|uniref:period circadian protein n=1 Tax=Aricia agestis TaxID=91739 RepID=UPI001C206A64|nr:period circadian protein [Aricia agestis]
MEIVEDTEKRSGVADSAYSYSCSNSKSTQSSKSTSESNSSGSSGYRGKRTDADYIKNNNAQPIIEKRVNDEIKTAEVKLKSAEVVNNHDAQTIESKDTSPPTTEDVKDGSDNVYLSSPPPTVGEGGNELDNMDISTSDKSTRQNKDLVFCIKTKDFFQSTVCDPHASSIICTIDYPNTHCSDGFFCVISMLDGVVMYTTLSISSSLGFPKDMWIGRSFTDFIHPNDRETFVSQVSNDSTLCKNVNASHVENHVSTMFCRIRRHKILTSGFGVKDRMPAFRPFFLKFFFKNIIEEDVIYLVIQAISLSSAFKTANEKVTNPIPFVIKHSANGNLKHIDRESMSYLGYLPQDIIDKDMFEFYHPADLVYLLQVYETLVKEGSYDRCKPYRMLAQNGNYIKLETEWMSYINPWSRKLEYIIGKHYVVEGPTNPNVFDSPEEETSAKLNEKERAKIQQVTNTIKKLLNEVLSKPTKLAKQQMTKRCQEIAAFMESFIDKTNAMPFKDNKCKTDSIKLGGILSHCTDSKSSTNTSISYDRLNYDETLQRYFDSHETCIINSYTTDYAFQPQPSTSKAVPPTTNAKVSPIPSEQTTTSTSSSPNSTVLQNKTVWLTESLLNKHNEKMEKKLVKTHYKNKSLMKGERGKSKEIKITKQKNNEILDRCNKSYQPTAGDHLAHLNGLKRPTDSMSCPIPCKTRCTVVNGDRTKSVAMVPVFPNAAIAPHVPIYYTPLQPQAIPVLENYPPNPFASTILPIPTTQAVPYMTYSIPYPYAPINQLPYTLEQSCMKQLMSQQGKSSCSNGESTDTNQFGEKKENSEGTIFNTDEDLSFSSLYSSFFKTESKSAEESEPKSGNKDDGKFWQRRLLMDDVSSNASCEPLRSQNVTRRKKEPPWMERVCVTSELIYKYQIFSKTMEEVLSGDRKKLEKLEQPALVNEQLGQLYIDMQLEGVAARLTLEEGITSSGSSSDENTAHASTTKKTVKRRHRGYDKMVIVYEEDAPLPPPQETETATT